MQNTIVVNRLSLILWPAKAPGLSDSVDETPGHGIEETALQRAERIIRRAIDERNGQSIVHIESKELWPYGIDVTNKVSLEMARKITELLRNLSVQSGVAITVDADCDSTKEDSKDDT